MTATPTERATLLSIARLLGPLREEVVFVGGVICSSLITDPGAPPPRPTDDIDMVAAVSSRVEYYELASRLRGLGFQEDHREGAPVCRWRIQGLTVDIMPDHQDVLGFSNRWYVSARASATWHQIGDAVDERIRIVDAPHFEATKLEAFRGRGESEYLHHDMEDMLAVVDGRAELLDELKVSPAALRAFVAEEIDALLKDEAFLEVLPAHLPGDSASQARLPLLLARLRAIASLRDCERCG